MRLRQSSVSLRRGRLDWFDNRIGRVSGGNCRDAEVRQCLRVRRIRASAKGDVWADAERVECDRVKGWRSDGSFSDADLTKSDYDPDCVDGYKYLALKTPEWYAASGAERNVRRAIHDM